MTDCQSAPQTATMNWKNVQLIFLREVRDQLRDRRTLFMIAVLPLLLYPALAIGMLQMTLLFNEQPRTVFILGEQHLPPPQLLVGDRFVSNWFVNPDDAEKLKVISDSSQSTDEKSLQLIEQARRIREKAEERTRFEIKLRQLESPQASVNEQSHSLDTSGPRVDATTQTKLQIAELKAKLATLEKELTELFATSQIQVLIFIPNGLKDNIERVNQLIAKHKTTADADLSYDRPI